jgi:hypothetical protein
MADIIVNQINTIFPIDYLTGEDIQQIVGTLVGKMMPIIQTRPVKERKELQKRITDWSKLVESDDLDKIVLDTDAINELPDVLHEFVFDILEKIVKLSDDQKDSFQLLTNKNYPYLYLVQGCLPISYENIDIKSLIQDRGEFIEFCFSQNVFDRNDTVRSIDDKFVNHFDEYLDNFIYCLEEYNDTNIVCLSSGKFGQSNSFVFKSSISEKRFLINRSTLLYLYEKGQWYTITFLDLENNTLRTYNEIRTRMTDSRLKRLLTIEYEKVNLDKLVVRYEPTDIGRKLPVINININDKSVKLLVGSTYNLYLYSSGYEINETNVIIGKIDIVNINNDDKVGKANIYWIEGYQDLL